LSEESRCGAILESQTDLSFFLVDLIELLEGQGSPAHMHAVSEVAKISFPEGT